MNDYIEMGRINTLKIDRFASPGAYLVSNDGSDVLLPNCYITNEMYVDDIIDVFIYTDSEDRIVATTQKPKAMLGEFGFFRVVAVKKFGAFVDWGLSKDLFVPTILQKRPFRVGERRIIRVTLDEKYDLLIGDERIGKYISYKPDGIQEKDAVECMVLAKTPMGFKVIVNNFYEGMIFQSDIFENLRVGDKRLGFIKKIREDGKLDISIRAIGEEKFLDTQKLILEKLSITGNIPFNYKSDPDIIQKVFKTSRKTFKKTLTTLIEKEIIEIKGDSIFLR